MKIKDPNTKDMKFPELWYIAYGVYNKHVADVEKVLTFCDSHQ